MTFTFSNNQEVDYLSLGMCDICGVRLTHGCEHSNTQNAQEWMAAYIVAEQGNDVDEDSVIESVGMAEMLEKYPADVAQQIESRIDAELGQHTIIIGGEALELSSAKPADNDNQIPF